MRHWKKTENIINCEDRLVDDTHQRIGVVTWYGLSPDGYRATAFIPENKFLGTYEGRDSAKKAVEKYWEANNARPES